MQTLIGMRFTTGLVGMLAIVTSCGDDQPPPDAGPSATDLEGTWVISSMTLPGPETLVRDGSPRAIRGDVVFTATSATTATLYARQVVTLDGMMIDQVKANTMPVTLEWPRFVLTTPDGVVVFTIALAGDHLVLAFDASDPRTTVPQPPSELVLDRIAPWTTTLVGAWDLVSIQLPTGTIVANTCIATNDGAMRVRMAITVSPELLFERTMTSTAYADPLCTVVMREDASTQRGMAEDAQGALRIWGIENSRSEFQSFGYAISGSDATLTRTACLPMPACEATAPIALTMRRAP